MDALHILQSESIDHFEAIEVHAGCGSVMLLIPFPGEAAVDPGWRIHMALKHAAEKHVSTCAYCKRIRPHLS